jgi:Ca2+-binding EF-hand superfamily protein
MDPVLSAVDTDHDGILTPAELAAAPDALKSLDKDGDGELSAAELRPRQMTASDRAKHMLDEWDTNKDGKLTKPEAPDRVQQQFDAIDTNHDRVLDEEELVSYFTNMPQQPRRPEGTGNAAPNSQGPRP